MKHHSTRKTGLWLRDVSLKAFAVFLLFGLAMYTYSAVTFPPNPAPVTGLVGQYVGSTSASNGNKNGYTNASADCRTAFQDSHICTAMEMINSYNWNNTTATSQAAEQMWINSGLTPLETATNDCQGWSSNAEGSFGNVWDFESDKPLLQTCNQSLKFACCK